MPVLGQSIINIFSKDTGIFGILNIALFPLQILINFLMFKNSAFGILMKKKK